MAHRLPLVWGIGVAARVSALTKRCEMLATTNQVRGAHSPQTTAVGPIRSPRYYVLENLLC